MAMAPNLRLRPIRRDDREVTLRAHELLRHDNFEFLLGWTNDTQWEEYVALCHRVDHFAGTKPGWVPSTLLLAIVDNEVVGRSSIRFVLNEYLLREAGHIGYGVLPEHRQRGYATEILQQSLVIARSHGVERVLVTADEDNLASRRTIERCGGQLENIVPGLETGDGKPKCRYWID